MVTDNQHIIQQFADELAGVVVICGHYGTGKTNFSLNLAYDLARAEWDVTLIDLDIVNPYFRSSDHGSALEAAGIELICPQSAGTALDSPMLSVAIDSAIEAAQRDEGRICIIDAGGDDVGATALGRFSKLIAQAPYAMLYVVNAAREMTRTPEEAAALLPEIEAASHLRATHLVNNTHLMQFTDAVTLEHGATFSEALSKALGLEVMCTTVPDLDHAVGSEGLPGEVAAFAQACERPYFVRIYVKKPWE